MARFEELKQVPLFAELSQRQLRRLARDLDERSYAPGVTLVRQDEMSGVGFFIIAEGEASVTVDGREIAILGPGEHFGELALISEQVRGATVTVTAPTRCYVMRSWDFRRFATENPDVMWKLLRYVVGLLTEERAMRARASLLSSSL